MTPSLEGWPTKAKEAPSPHEVRQTPLDTNPVFQCVGDIILLRSTGNCLLVLVVKQAMLNLASKVVQKAIASVYRKSKIIGKLQM